MYVHVCLYLGGGGFVVVVVKDKSDKDRWLQVERGCNDKKKSCVQSAEWNEQVWFCVENVWMGVGMDRDIISREHPPVREGRELFHEMTRTPPRLQKKINNK